MTSRLWTGAISIGLKRLLFTRVALLVVNLLRDLGIIPALSEVPH